MPSASADRSTCSDRPSLTWRTIEMSARRSVVSTCHGEAPVTTRAAIDEKLPANLTLFATRWVCRTASGALADRRQPLVAGTVLSLTLSVTSESEQRQVEVLAT